MKYNVATNAIQEGVLYIVAGVQSATYNSVTYATGEVFRGVAGVSSFTYSGSGTQEVNELTELKGGSIEFATNDLDIPDNFFPEQTVLKGFAVEFIQQGDDIFVLDETIIKGFAIEYVDYPIYAFGIMERRL